MFARSRTIACIRKSIRWRTSLMGGGRRKGMGVKKGDRVTTYMGRIPELPIAMLACAKSGAIHSVVYGGFSVEALADRIEDAHSRVLLTADGAWLRGEIVALKDVVDEAAK